VLLCSCLHWSVSRCCFFFVFSGMFFVFFRLGWYLFCFYLCFFFLSVFVLCVFSMWLVMFVIVVISVIYVVVSCDLFTCLQLWVDIEFDIIFSVFFWFLCIAQFTQVLTGSHPLFWCIRGVMLVLCAGFWFVVLLCVFFFFC